MGCVLGREVSSAIVYEGKEEKRVGESERKSKKDVSVESSETVEVEGRKVEVTNGGVESDGTQKVEKGDGDGRLRDERRRSRATSRLSNVPKHRHGERVTAGWPAWLSDVIGDAIDGWLPRRADSFEKIDKIGQGTYSNVYKARDTITGKIVALKKVRFDNLERESVRFMAREIIILRRLDHPNVIKLEGLVTSRMSCSLYLVFEYMEHDLAGLAASPDISFTQAQIKCYMHQLLSGLEHCHNRNVLHRDIKGSNLLLDNGGVLKIADFGLATVFDPNRKHPLTSRVVTLWYRPPELLLGATDYGVGIDLWSAGCILAELLAGKPIMPGRTEVLYFKEPGKNIDCLVVWRLSINNYLSVTKVEQLHKIYKLCGSPSDEYWRKSKLPNATLFRPREPYKRCISETFKAFPPSSLPLIETLLAIDPAERGTATDALRSEVSLLETTMTICFMPLEVFIIDIYVVPLRYGPCKVLEFNAKLEDKLRWRFSVVFEFFNTEPYACDPSSLPQYPPSKEMDAKRRDDESRRLRAASKAQGDPAKRTRSRDRHVRAVPAPEANAELQSNLDRRRLVNHANAKSKSEKFPPPHQDGGLGIPLGASHHFDPSIVPPDVPFSSTSFSYAKDPIQNWSGPLVDPVANGAGRRRKHSSVDARGKKDKHSHMRVK
ncbi:hypothetical protein RJ640_013338 [Escallonia rubra]|uniref:Protein kinase domain-containing protein n=1 Tax=Escallonia rubra TaxID=112253 RepID=A0AA88QUM7_9ASTE|nr:hypothetical protein RJ640_013338 [Escallonia rubra]